MKVKTIFLLIFAVVTLMGQDYIQLTLSSPTTAQENPVAGASYVLLPDRIEFRFPDGSMYRFPRYDLFDPQTTITVDPVGSSWHYELTIASAKTSKQPIRKIRVDFASATQFANASSQGWSDTQTPYWFNGAIKPGDSARFGFDSDRKLPVPIPLILSSEDLSSDEDQSQWARPENYHYFQFIERNLPGLQQRLVLITPRVK